MLLGISSDTLVWLRNILYINTYFDIKNFLIY